MPDRNPQSTLGVVAAVPSLRIFVAERDAAVRFGLRAFFAQECPGWMVCGEADHARNALGRCLSASPELVLLDPEMEGGGWTFLRQVRQLLPHLPCVARLSRADAGLVLASHREGVRALCTTSDPLPETCEALGHARLGNAFISAQLRRALGAGASREAERRLADADGMTVREREVYLGLGRGLTCQEIAGELGIARKTVHSHCERLKRKFFLHSIEALRHRAALAAGLEPACDGGRR